MSAVSSVVVSGVSQSPSGRPSWVEAGAFQAWDFANNRFWNGAYDYAGAAGYALNSDDEYEAFSANALRRTDIGALIEPGFTNKVETYNANPTDTTGFVTGGLASGATLTVVDDAAALAAAGLDAICTSGKVFHLDNTGAASASNITIAGETGNTNDHTISFFWRGSGTARIQLLGQATSNGTIPAAYERLTETQTPAATNKVFQILALAGADLYFILPQLVESDAALSPVVTTGSSAARSADNLDLTINEGGHDLVFTFDDDSTQTVNSVSAGSYDVPTTLDRRVIKSVVLKDA